MTGIKIMVVDDEARMRKLIADFLKREGYLVVEAEDGRKALDCFLYQKHSGRQHCLLVFLPHQPRLPNLRNTHISF